MVSVAFDTLIIGFSTKRESLSEGSDSEDALVTLSVLVKLIEEMERNKV